MSIASLAQGKNQTPESIHPDKSEFLSEIGLSLENPIVVKDKFSSFEEVQKYQESYIRDKFPDCVIRMENFTMGKNNEYIHFFTVKSPDGKFIDIYFDLTKVYKKIKSKNKKMKDKVTQFENFHKPAPEKK